MWFFCLKIRDATPWGTWFRTFYQFIMRWERKEEKEKMPSTQQDSNPRPLELILPRHFLYRCATTAARKTNTYRAGERLPVLPLLHRVDRRRRRLDRWRRVAHGLLHRAEGHHQRHQVHRDGHGAAGHLREQASSHPGETSVAASRTTGNIKVTPNQLAKLSFAVMLAFTTLI